MKKTIMSNVMMCGFVLVATLGAGEANAAIESRKEKISYSIGRSLVGPVESVKDDLDLDAFVQGIKDAFIGVGSPVTEEETKQLMIEFSAEVRKKLEVKMAQVGQINATEGTQYLKENKLKQGVKTTGSGLQYIILREGEGAQPTTASTVKVHYRGTLLNGEVFDSSYDRGEPVTFPVEGVIPGWTEALQLMKVGSKFKLFIPSNLAYAERGAGRQIGPNASLIFEVELLSVE